MKNLTLDEMKEAISQYYEAAGFVDCDKNILSKMSEAEIYDAYDKIISEEEEDG